MYEFFIVLGDVRVWMIVDFNVLIGVCIYNIDCSILLNDMDNFMFILILLKMERRYVDWEVKLVENLMGL